MTSEEAKRQAAAGGSAKRSHRITVAAAWFGIAIALLVAGCSSSIQEPTIPSLPPPTEPLPTVTTTPDLELPTDTTLTDTTPDEIRLRVGDDFGAIVEASPEGTSFVIEPGIHRLQEVNPKDGMTFEGMPGAVMNGAIEIEDWFPSRDGVWEFAGITKTAFEHGACIDGYEGCRLTQDLYMDDVMLWQVTDASDLGPGRWYWEGSTIFVGDDPSSRRVELSIATHAFMSAASDVTIRGLVVEKYAVPAQFGAIQSAVPGDGSGPLGRGWLIEDTEIRLNHGAGVRMGDDTTLRRLYVHTNGQLGVTASGGSGGLVEDSEIAGNNIAGFDWGWEGGGSKFKETVGLVVRRNIVRDNEGPGLWTDIDNYDTLYEDNEVTGNSGPGIFHEISYDAVIRNNVVTGNGFGFGSWLWGSGILIAASRDVEVYGNTVTGNANGIGGIQQERGDGAEGPWLLSNLFVHDNTMTLGEGRAGVVEDVGDVSVFAQERGNRFESNIYVNATGKRYFWEGKKLDASGWQSLGQDLEGTWR
jgi:parallel beta-helix repeat protein